MRTAIAMLAVLALAPSCSKEPEPPPAAPRVSAADAAPLAKVEPPATAPAGGQAADGGPADATPAGAAKPDAAAARPAPTKAPPAAPRPSPKPPAPTAAPPKPAPAAPPEPKPAPAAPPEPKPAPAAPPPAAASGVTPEIQALWSKKCAGCHGRSGTPGGAMATKMAIASMATAEWQKQFSDAEIRKATTAGVNREKDGVKQKMNAYNLTPAELDGLVALIRSFR